MGKIQSNNSYNQTAFHFDKSDLPPILLIHLQNQVISLADLGCGDGPWFDLLSRRKIISPIKPVFAVDLSRERLLRVKNRFPWITTINASVDDVPQIPSETIDWVFSTMVMEHIPNEEKYLSEIYRILNHTGNAYITTVFKRKWAWYFRKRDGTSVLDVNHLREYTDLAGFMNLVKLNGKFSILDLKLSPLWFPLMDPILFRLYKLKRLNNRLVNVLRKITIPILGYYELHVILTKRVNISDYSRDFLQD